MTNLHKFILVHNRRSNKQREIGTVYYEVSQESITGAQRRIKSDGSV